MKYIKRKRTRHEPEYIVKFIFENSIYTEIKLWT